MNYNADFRHKEYKVFVVDPKTAKHWFVGKIEPFAYKTTDNIDEAVGYTEAMIESMKLQFPELVIVKLLI